MSEHNVEILKGDVGADPEVAAFLVHAVVSECQRQERLNGLFEARSRAKGLVAVIVTKDHLIIRVHVSDVFTAEGVTAELAKVKAVFLAVAKTAYAKTYPGKLGGL